MKRPVLIHIIANIKNWTRGYCRHQISLAWHKVPGSELMRNLKFSDIFTKNGDAFISPLNKLLFGHIIFLMIISNNFIIGQNRFTNITEQAGIDHQFQVFEGMFGGGICVFDMNNDGFEDLYITSGMNEDRMYVNKGDGTFKNSLNGSGLEITKDYVTQGVSSADVNRDGFIDLFVTTITTKHVKQEIPRAINLLFINKGDGTFRDATAEYKLDHLQSFSTGINFGDFNNDGFPDAYVGNYFLDYDGQLSEINDATIVNASRTAQGYLLINKKGKYFVDEYEAYGLNHRGFGFGGVTTDIDNDGDQDIFVNHDFGYKAKPNYVLINQYPKQKFIYAEKELDLDVKINAMGAAVGDYNLDGLMDYFITNIKFNHFMVNEGSGKPFVNKAKELGTHMFTISWGANFADFDHDGDEDLFVANGDLNPNIQPMGNYYFENNGDSFLEKGRAYGMNDYGIARGSVVFDIENDGDLDLLVVNQNPVLENYPVESRTILMRNDSSFGNWIKIKLEGKKSLHRGIGSRVEIVANGKKQIREVDGGAASHLSQNSSIAHFGLADASIVDSIIIKWSSEEDQIILNQKSNQLVSISQEVNEKKSMSLSMLLISITALIFLCFAIFKIKSKG